MMLAAVGIQELTLVLPLLALWIAVLVWFARGKPTVVARVAVLAIMALFSGGLVFFLLASVAARTQIDLAKNQRVVVEPSSERALVYNLDRPCSLQVDAVELFGKNIEFRVLQDGQTIYRSAVHMGKANGTVPVAEGTVSVSFVNENLVEGKTVQVNVVALPR